MTFYTITNKRLWACCLVLSLGLSFVIPAQSGIISGLAKLGKAGKKADVDVSVGKVDVDLPDDMAAYTPVKLVESTTGEWHVKLPDGSHVALQHLDNVPGAQKHALIIDRHSLPSDLSEFDNIPPSYPVFIKGQGKSLFSFKTGERKLLSYHNVDIEVFDGNSLNRAMWHLQRPLMSKGTRWLYLDQDINKVPLDGALSHKAKVESVGGLEVLDIVRRSRLKTVVLSGEVKGGRLLIPGSNKGGIDLAALRRAAAEGDVTLLILDSLQPGETLKLASLKLRSTNPQASTAEVMAQIARAENNSSLELTVNASERSQVAIKLTPSENRVAKRPIESGEGLVFIDFNTPILILKPDQEREKELDERIIPSVHSYVSYYLILSAVIGFIFIGSCWRFWNKVWMVKEREQYKNWLFYVSSCLVHHSFFILIFIPVLGAPSFLLAVILVVTRIINFVVIRPVRWLIRVMSSVLA